MSAAALYMHQREQFFIGRYWSVGRGGSIRVKVDLFKLGATLVGAIAAAIATVATTREGSDRTMSRRPWFSVRVRA